MNQELWFGFPSPIKLRMTISRGDDTPPCYSRPQSSNVIPNLIGDEDDIASRE